MLFLLLTSSPSFCNSNTIPKSKNQNSISLRIWTVFYFKKEKGLFSSFLTWIGILFSICKLYLLVIYDNIKNKFVYLYCLDFTTTFSFTFNPIQWKSCQYVDLKVEMGIGMEFTLTTNSSSHWYSIWKKLTQSYVSIRQSLFFVWVSIFIWIPKSWISPPSCYHLLWR